MGHHLPLLPGMPHHQAEEFRDPEAGAMAHNKEGLIAQGAKACKRLGTWISSASLRALHPCMGWSSRYPLLPGSALTSSLYPNRALKGCKA
jgi:hypothetical protein